MLVFDYILLFVIVILLSMLLQRYYDKKEIKESKEMYVSIHHYLLNETSLVKNKNHSYGFIYLTNTIQEIG